MYPLDAVSALPPPPPMEETSYPSNMGLTDEMPPPPEFIQTSDVIDTNAPAEYLDKGKFSLHEHFSLLF